MRRVAGRAILALMPKRQSRKPERDVNEAAFAAVQRVIGLTEGEDVSETKPLAPVLPMQRRKNQAAVALGRRGGLQRAKSGIEKIDPARRREIASAAARVRWAKKYQADEG